MLKHVVALIIYDCVSYQVIDVVVLLLAKEMTKDPRQIQTHWYLPFALSVNTISLIGPDFVT